MQQIFQKPVRYAGGLLMEDKALFNSGEVPVMSQNQWQADAG